VDDKRKQPVLVVAALALIGAVSIPQVLKPPGGTETSSSADSTDVTARPPTIAEQEEKDLDRRDLKPLIDFLASGNGKQPTGGLNDQINNGLASFYHPQTPDVFCMVITLPDPVASVTSIRFDEYLDVVQRAVELQGFILDRSSLPWQTTNPNVGAVPDRTTRLRNERSGWELTADSTTPKGPRRGRPGLVVFKTPLTNAKTQQRPGILLTFIVPESSVLGIDKHAFGRALELIDKYFYARLTEERREVIGPRGQPAIDKNGKLATELTGRRVLHVVAPNFDGSQWSLEVALRGWRPREKQSYHLRILSNNAGRIDKKHLEDGFDSTGNVVTFRSMVHKASAVQAQMLDYLRELGYHRSQLAILIESNSGIPQAEANDIVTGRRRKAAGKGADKAPGDKPGEDVDNSSAEDFIFPLQVSEIRKAYVKRGIFQNNKPDSAGSPERLPIPTDESGTPDDVPRSFTPASSAALDEMALTQILTTISRRPYQAVGIFASNPLDTVFLARCVRRFCPNLRIFTTQADLLFARPQLSGDLRGMLVASTYSLYPANQWIATSNGARPHVLFSNQGSQGLYNTIVAHLWEMGIPDQDTGPQLLEFAPPYETTPQIYNPSVWIGVVGERGLFPLKTLGVPGDSSYIYDPHNNPERRRFSVPDETQKLEKQNLKAMKPTPHLLYWLSWLVLVFACFLVSGLTWVYARWATDEHKIKLNAKIAFVGLGHLMRYLNYEVAPEDFRAQRTSSVHAGRGGNQLYNPQARFEDETKNPYPPRLGAGIFLCLANVLLWAVSSYTFSLMLIGMKPYKADMKAFQIGIYYLTLVSWALSSASVILSVALAIAEDGLGRLNAGRVPYPPRYNRVLFGLAFVSALIGLLVYVAVSEIPPPSRLSFERYSNLPSGVSPLFPVQFLVGTLVAFVYFQLARRSLYRQSYLPATLSAEVSRDRGSRSQQVVRRLREQREEIDELISKPLQALKQVNPIVMATLSLLALFYFIRLYFRGPARSFEGYWFDWFFLAGFTGAAVLIIGCALQLLVVWTHTRSMLKLTIDLPMAQAFDRIPERLKGWFFGSHDFRMRKELVLRQSAALKERSTHELNEIFKRIFPFARAEPTIAATATGDSGNVVSDWDDDLARLLKSLDDPEGTIDSTRAVYPFLDRVWDALPIEEAPRQLRSSSGGSGDCGSTARTASWPLMPRDRAKLSDDEFAALRDWVRMAEDLVALQIVRWFAPVLSQLLPVMKFVVIGSLFLLLTLTSYPFDHQGWMMTVMVTILLFVGGIVTVVLVGVNRDELISRVSDTAPGRVSFDNTFINLCLTTLGPLLAALFAISFDVSDLLHTFFGPVFQLF
jgi:hypothetical protein